MSHVIHRSLRSTPIVASRAQGLISLMPVETVS
jgi:hypothetical protein